MGNKCVLLPEYGQSTAQVSKVQNNRFCIANCDKIELVLQFKQENHSQHVYIQFFYVDEANHLSVDEANHLSVDEANHLSVADATLKVIELQSNPSVVAIGFSRPSS